MNPEDINRGPLLVPSALEREGAALSLACWLIKARGLLRAAAAPRAVPVSPELEPGWFAQVEECAARLEAACARAERVATVTGAQEVEWQEAQEAAARGEWSPPRLETAATVPALAVGAQLAAECCEALRSVRWHQLSGQRLSPSRRSWCGLLENHASTYLRYMLHG